MPLATLDVNGDAAIQTMNTSGSQNIVVWDPITKVLGINNTIPGGGIGNCNQQTMINANNGAINLNSNNFYFLSGANANFKNKVSIGYPCSSNVWGKLSVIETTPNTTYNFGISYAGYFANNANGVNSTGIISFVYGNASNKFGVYGLASTTLFPTSIIPPPVVYVGVAGIALEGTSNIGVYGQAPVSVNASSWAGYFEGDVYISGTGSSPNGVFTTSDSILKTNIETFSNARNIVGQLKSRSFYFDTAQYPYLNLPVGVQYGLIAEDVQTVLPNLVKNIVYPGQRDSLVNVTIPELTYKGLNYTGLIPIAIQAVKELDSIVTTLISPPPAPVLISPANGAADQPRCIDFYWHPSKKAVSYKIFFSTTPDSAGVFKSFTISDTTFKFGSDVARTCDLFSPGQTFYWAVIAINQNGNSQPSSIWSFTIMPQMQPPVLISPANGATNIPINGLVLSWHPVAGAINYTVNLSTTGGGIYPVITTADTFFVCTWSLNYQKTYNWTVTARNDYGDRATSETWSFTTEPPPPPPAAPLLISPVNGDNTIPIGSNVKLTWAQSAGALNYNVYVLEGTRMFFNGNVKDTFVVVKIDKGPVYNWYVNACNGYGCSGNSETWSFIPVMPAPPSAPPALVSPANNETNITNVKLTWRKVADATYYNFSVSLTADFTQVIYNNSVPDTSAIFSASSFTTYYWRVSACNVGGCSNPSEAWQFTTGQLPVPAPPILIDPVNGATDISPDKIRLSWNASAGASDYKVYVSLNADGSNIVYSYNPKDTYVYIDKADLQTTYYWYVHACNSFGCSDKSEIWSFTTKAGFKTGTPEISDAALKTNVAPFTGALSKVEQLNGIYFNWDTLQYPNLDFESGRQIGLIAQDVQPVIPEVVKVDKLGYRYINYNRFVPVLIEAVKELNNKNTQLTNVADSLKNVIASYETRFASIESILANCCQNPGVKTQQGDNNAGQSSVVSDALSLSKGHPSSVFENTEISTVIHITPDGSVNEKITELYQNRPNPFTVKTTFTYTLGKTGFVELEIHSELGMFITKLVNSNQSEGNYSIDWDTADLAPGIYFYSLKVDGMLWVKKAVRIK
ncbi:MAG: tail fiber domain-containing protein [Bacteroidia bacterium]|nr:tail fiber domain-containing protein [Bacteroidia bacterium]